MDPRLSEKLPGFDASSMAQIPEYDVSSVTRAQPTSTCLKEVITTRQFVFMGLSSSIGAGLLVSTGQALAVGGAASLLIALAVVGFAVWITMCALGELSTNFPVKGSFYEYSVRFISPSWGFAMGWNYVMEFIIVVPFEIIVMVMCARFWNPDISALYIVPLFIACLIIIYSLGARWFAEAENVFGVLKIIVITIFSMTAICIVTGGVPTDTRPASQLAYNDWRTEAFKNDTPGFFFVFMAAGMAYGGTEMLGLTAAECRSPRYVMRLASRLVAGRIVLLYILPILMLGLILDINIDPTASSKDGTTATSSSDILVSPFVLAISQAKIPLLPGIVNAIFIVAFFSMANASVFASSRALQAISARGMGPRFCAALHRGKPLGALAVVFLFSLLSFTEASRYGDVIFVWLLSLASCSNYLTWASICVAQIRYRSALKRQGRSPGDPVTYRSPFGIAGSVFAVAVFAFGIVAQIAASAKSPLPTAPPIAASFTGLLVVVVLWVGYMIWKRDNTLLVPLDLIDLGPKEGTITIMNTGAVEYPTV